MEHMNATKFKWVHDAFAYAERRWRSSRLMIKESHKWMTMSKTTMMIRRHGTMEGRVQVTLKRSDNAEFSHEKTKVEVESCCPD